MRAPFARTLHDLACEQAERYGAAPALISQGREISYAELAAGSARVTAALRRHGVRRGDRIGLVASNRREWVEIALGAGGAGASLVPFSTWSTRQELEFLLADSNISLLFSQESFGDRNYAADLSALLCDDTAESPSEAFRQLKGVVLIDARRSHSFRSWEEFLGGGSEDLDHLPPGEAAGADDDGLVLYTSGSSAKPKAVRLQHFGIVENGFNIGERQGLGPGDRVLLSPPLFWSYGSANAMAATLTHGGALVLQERFAAAEALELIERHACTAIYTLPSITKAILRDPAFAPERCKTLRTGLTIGSPQDVIDAAERLGAREICNIYGATETYGNCCVTWHHWPLTPRAQCQGPPLPGNTLRLVDPETGCEVASGEPGLVEVGGYITAGYSGASAEYNETAFTADGFYRTGDMARLNESGAIVFLGRSTELIKRAGINISPAEVEDILLRHPAVVQAGVVGVPDEERGEMVVAFVVPSEAQAVSPEALSAYCRSVASKYKVPDRIEICAAVPVTPTGKLQRRELKKIAAELVATGKVAHG